MNISEKTSFGLVIFGIAIVLGIGLFIDYLNQVALIITSVAFGITLFKLIILDSDNRRSKKQNLHSIINPSLKPLLKILEIKDESIEIRDGFIQSCNKFFKKNNLTETVVLSCFEFANILKIDKQYRRSYALSLAFHLSEVHSVDDGKSAETIDNSVRNRGTSPYGTDYELTQNEINWYKKFCESKEIMTSDFEKLLEDARRFEIESIDEEYSRFTMNKKEVKAFIDKKDAKLDTLIELIVKKIPTANLSKILSTLRAEVVIVSSEGSKDEKTGSDKRGSAYLNEVLDKKMPPKNKLNRSVRFALLDEIRGDEDLRSFDLYNWGLEIDKEAKKLRSADNGDTRSFSFVVLTSSMHDLYVFGDTLPERGMIKISPDVVEGLTGGETTESTLQLLAKTLTNENTTLQDFINYNLEYLEGVPTKTTADYIISSMRKQFSVDKWKISDFPRFDVQPEHITALGYSEDIANSIISESKQITKLLKLS